MSMSLKWKWKRSKEKNALKSSGSKKELLDLRGKSRSSNTTLIDRCTWKRSRCSKNLPELSTRKSSRSKKWREKRELRSSDLNKKPIDLTMKRELKVRDSKEK